MAKKELSYKQAFDELKEIAESLDKGELEIDQLTSKIKRATELLQICKEKLRTIENDINMPDSPS